jgi:asparagine synthase (glutamine-hydrolysing)
MCGILGGFDCDSEARARLDVQLRALTHRGPDAQNVLAGPGFMVGHTLLSIIGDSPIEQPIVSSDGRIVLTYNGEIYNYLELLEEDEALRSRCSVRSDTKVLVEGIALHGIDFVTKANGIFAFAVWDKERREGYLVRDRLGVKPLYWSSSAEGFFFGSEAKPLLALAGADSAPDPEAFYAYARFRYPTGARSFARAARMVEPGTIVTITAGDIKTRAYWKIEEPIPFEGSYEEAKAEAKALFLDAVRIQMRSDHSFCTYLSGGLDSSYLSAIAVETKTPLDTYSIGLESEEFDESMYANQVARHIGSRHHPYLIQRDEYRREHTEFIRHLGAPLSVPNQVAIKSLSRELSRDHRCVLSGEGADEVFGGYGRIFLLPADWERLRGNDPALASGIAAKLRHKLGRDDFSDYCDLFLQRYGYLDHDEAVSVMAPHFTADAMRQARESVEGEIRTAFDGWSCDLYARQLLLFQKIHLPGLLLRVDTATMAHSVEGRVPFLDHRVVEFMNRLPTSYKMRRKKSYDSAVSDGLLSDELSEVHDTPKSLLKQIAEELLPNEIIYRRKVGFPMPRGFYAPESSTPTTSQQPSYIDWIERNMQILANHGAPR